MKKALFSFIIMALALPNLSLAVYDDNDDSCDVSSLPVPEVSVSHNPEPGVTGVLVSWNMIEHEDFKGYKVVISENNPTPVYSADGYLKYITSRDTVGFLVNNATAYRNGDFGSYLTVGEEYYFSVTALYDCGGSTVKVAGNAVQATYGGGIDDTPVTPPYPVCDHNSDGLYNLSDVALFAACSSTFDANGDGVHNLTDVSLYTANYTDQDWCETNVSECAPVQSIDYDSNATTQQTCDHNGDGLYNLTDVGLFAACMDTFDANGDGVHNLTDISLYAQNHNDQAWCLTNVSECNNIDEEDDGVYYDYLDIAQTKVTNLSETSVKIWWKAVNAGSTGHYRLSTSEAALENLPWISSGVQNHPDQTGNMFASQVTLTGLEPGTKYYIELKKTIASGAGYGTPKTIHFTTEDSSDLPVPVVGSTSSDSGILLTWDKIDDSRFKGYKVVISKNDSTPAYPSNGYLKYITNEDTTSHLINNSSAYRNGDFGSYLTVGENYYFSITALYNAGRTKVAGNAIQLAYVGPENENDNDDVMRIYNASGRFYSDTTAKIKWKTNGYYDCTVIFSTKDGNLDDDALVPGRDPDDIIFGSNYPLDGGSGYSYSIMPNHNQIDATDKKAYFKVICYDEDRNKKTSPVHSFSRKSNVDPLVDMRDKAKKLRNSELGDILAELQQLRNQIKEQENELKYLRSLVHDLSTIAQKVRDSLNQFITYGVDENTQKLGEGERAAVIHSFKSAFGKLPETDDELTDAIKIANGRWPSKTNEAAENRAKVEFRRIYLRDADMSNPNDNAAVTVMAYGLRQKAENRNLDSERQGINTFKYIYGHTPGTTEEWNIMQAITYSGASR